MSARVRPRLSRTLSRARWDEYRRFLETVLERGYEVQSLEEWVVARDELPAEQPIVVLRHDVDQHPASALRMAALETELGITSTWYLRWRTAHPEVISRLREGGFAVGLHYETLSREVLAHGLGPDDDLTGLVPECRSVLQREIAAFASAFGPIRSVCPHGDSRVPFALNGQLLRDEDCAPYGIAFDGNEAMRGRRLGYWLTDRAGADGGWADGRDPRELLERRVSPILCLVHPNNWASGVELWRDRLLRAVLPAGLRRPIRGGPDTPPL